MSVEAHTTEIEALNKKNRENNKALMEKVLAKSKAAEEKATAEKAAHDLLKEELKSMLWVSVLDSLRPPQNVFLLFLFCFVLFFTV